MKITTMVYRTRFTRSAGLGVIMGCVCMVDVVHPRQFAKRRFYEFGSIVGYHYLRCSSTHQDELLERISDLRDGDFAKRAKFDPFGEYVLHYQNLLRTG